MRWRSWSRSGLASSPRSCGWPSRMVCSSGLPALRDVGEHAQLLERRVGEGLRLVDDQQVAALGGLQPADDAAQHRGLVAVRGGAEGIRDQAQQVVARDLRRDDAGDDEALRVKLGAEPLDQRGLARADLAGDDDEAFLLRQPVHQVGIGAAVPRARVEQPRIRRHLEGMLAEAVMVDVHGGIPAERVRRCSVGARRWGTA